MIIYIDNYKYKSHGPKSPETVLQRTIIHLKLEMTRRGSANKGLLLGIYVGSYYRILNPLCIIMIFMMMSYN